MRDWLSHACILYPAAWNLCIVCVHAAETAEIDKAKEIIKKMTFNYQSDSFENPG